MRRFHVTIIHIFYGTVTDFSKKTGDYRNLSAVDIRLIALTYQLEKEHCGSDHIKTVPEKSVGLI